MAETDGRFYSDPEVGVFSALDDSMARESLSGLRASPLSFDAANATFPYGMAEIVEHEGLCFATPSRSASATVLLAGDFMNNDEITVGNSTLDDLLTAFVNIRFIGAKRLYSAFSGDCLALEFHKYSSEIIGAIYPYHLETPFILCGEDRTISILINFDLYVTTVSVFGEPSVDFGGYEDSFWNDRFEREFQRLIPGRKEHIDFVQEHFVRKLNS